MPFFKSICLLLFCWKMIFLQIILNILNFTSNFLWKNFECFFIIHYPNYPFIIRFFLSSKPNKLHRATFDEIFFSLPSHDFIDFTFCFRIKILNFYSPHSSILPTDRKNFFLKNRQMCSLFRSNIYAEIF